MKVLVTMPKPIKLLVKKKKVTKHTKTSTTQSVPKSEPAPEPPAPVVPVTPKPKSEPEPKEVPEPEPKEETTETPATEAISTLEPLPDKRVVKELEQGIEYITRRRNKDDTDKAESVLDDVPVDESIEKGDIEIIQQMSVKARRLKKRAEAAERRKRGNRPAPVKEDKKEDADKKEDDTDGPDGPDGPDGADEENDGFMTLNEEQKEALIDKLEDKKYRLKKEYKQAKKEEQKKAVKKEYEEVSRLLANVKECDAWDKINHNKQDSKKLREEFRKKYKRLRIDDFKQIIDLTAPKKDRKPEYSTETIWHRSKEVVFKGKKYREASQEKQEKFKKKMTLKPMPKNLRKDMSKRRDGNLNAYHLHNNNAQAIHGYQKYDPLNYQGNYVY